MPAPVTDVDILKTYIEGVMTRADHHAQGVAGVGLTLAGAIVWRKDADAIEVMSQGGDMKNVLWVRISGQRYAFSYNHATGDIEMRRGTTHGPLVNAFNDKMTPDDVRQIFAAL